MEAEIRKQVNEEFRRGRHIVPWNGYIRVWFYKCGELYLQVKNYQKGKWSFSVGKRMLKGHHRQYLDKYVVALFTDNATCADAKKLAQNWYLNYLVEKRLEEIGEKV